jgi:hypothetical protein
MAVSRTATAQSRWKKCSRPAPAGIWTEHPTSVAAVTAQSRLEHDCPRGRGARAQVYLRLALPFAGALVLTLPELIVVLAGGKVDAASGLLLDEHARKQASRQLVALAEVARKTREVA